MRFWRHFPKSAFKFAVFALVCLVALVVLAIKIGNISLFSSRATVYAQLGNVIGLNSGDPVDIAGVQVGQVGSITVQRSHALVGLSLDSNIVLHSASDVGLRWKNVIGQKEVYLYPDNHGPVLKAGATIPLTHDVSDASVDAFLNSFGPFLQSINPNEANEFVENVSGALQNDTVEIDQLIDNGATVANTVGGLDAQVGNVITSLDQVLTAIASRSTDVSSLVSNLQTVAQTLASRNDVLDAVVGNLSKVAGDLSVLIGSNRTDLSNTISNLDTVTADIVAHQGDLATSLATLGGGLAPYVEISAWGQWFQIQTVYTCLANQTACTYYQPTNAEPGSGLGGGPPLSATSDTKTTDTKTADTVTPNASAELHQSPVESSVPLVLGLVAGGSGISAPAVETGQ